MKNNRLFDIASKIWRNLYVEKVAGWTAFFSVIFLFVMIFWDLLIGKQLTIGPSQKRLILILLVIIVSSLYIIRDKLKRFRFGSQNKVFLFNEDILSQETTNHQQLPSHQIPITIFCIILSLVYLLVCTKSSPLYPLNDWVDANAFFTIGKGMANGRIPYKDLFGQKGPYLYLIHSAAYLISKKAFLGVFVFELISFSVFLFYVYKISSLFVKKRYLLLILPFVTTGILNLQSFSHGDSAEEFCLPLLAISLYYLVNYFKTVFPKLAPKNWMIINGIVAGCVLWIKFSMLGFWVGWIFSFFIVAIINKKFQTALNYCIFFLLGMVIASIPWIIYFGINQAIYDWVHSYIIINFTLYRKEYSLIQSLLSTLKQIIYRAKANPIINIILWLGVGTASFTKLFFRFGVQRILFLMNVLLLVFGVYGGGRSYVYYPLIYSPFIIFGFLTILFVLGQFGEIRNLIQSVIAAIAIIISTALLTFRFNQNSSMLKTAKEDMAQFQFAEIIDRKEDATLLNFGTYDLGFYTASGITPNVKYFMKWNLAYPVMMDEQNRYVEEKMVDFIVMRFPEAAREEYKRIKTLTNNYQLLDSKRQRFDNNTYYFLLFEKIPD